MPVLSTTRIGLVAADEVFDGSGGVILEESERRRWFAEVYQPNDKAFWWFAFAWWTIEEGLASLDSDEETWLRQRHPISAASSYWIVKSGVHWGPLAGGCVEELWGWNGERADFIEKYRRTMF